MGAFVFVLDRRKKPLMPCSEKRARLLLERGRARVHRVRPFTIRLVDRLQADCELQPVRVKIDPGSKATGLALVREIETVEPETGEIDRPEIDAQAAPSLSPLPPAPLSQSNQAQGLACSIFATPG